MSKTRARPVRESCARCKDNRNQEREKFALSGLHDCPALIENQLKLAFQERACSMTEPDILSRKIKELTEWQRVAWRRVADPSVTDFERREIRNHIKESDEHLRYYLRVVSERHRLQSRNPA